MSEDTKDLRVWILALAVVGLIAFEEARFSRRHNDRPSFPEAQVGPERAPDAPNGISAKPSAPSRPDSDPDTDAAVRFAESGEKN